MKPYRSTGVNKDSRFIGFTLQLSQINLSERLCLKSQ